ncbi:ribulose-phosphate 3-epimerase [Calycomorphotria hydatis]|nr:ribulose-phosphate 3-epimerase [Calycomorphotria hydatis]
MNQPTNSRSATLAKLKCGKPIIAPSMLKCDFGDMRGEFSRLAEVDTPVLHWDVMDGHFVPNLTYGAAVIERYREHTDLIFDTHLMITSPERWWKDYAKAGCQTITFHLEAVEDPRPLLEEIREADIVAGLTINPDTPVSAVEPYLDYCDQVLVMSVNPGFGGQSFMPSALPKLRSLRESREELLLAVDGGIAVDTIGDVAAAGAELFVAGSSVFGKPDYRAAAQGLVESALSGIATC